MSETHQAIHLDISEWQVIKMKNNKKRKTFLMSVRSAQFMPISKNVYFFRIRVTSTLYLQMLQIRHIFDDLFSWAYTIVNLFSYFIAFSKIFSNILTLLRRTSFWPPSMVYISVIITHIQFSLKFVYSQMGPFSNY